LWSQKTRPYDFKDYLGTGVRNQVPPLMVKTSYLWTASDPAFAAVNGDDILPDLAIGRLPAANPEEARAMVEKILVHEVDFRTASASETRCRQHGEEVRAAREGAPPRDAPRLAVLPQHALQISRWLSPRPIFRSRGITRSDFTPFF